MNTLIYSLSIFAVFLGLIAGWILSRISKEELKPGKTYFLIAEKIIMFAAFAVFLYSIKLKLLIFIIASIALLAFAVFIRIEPYIAYPIFGFMLYIAYASNSPLFFALASACFAYGLPAAMFMASNKAKLKSMITHNIGFFVTAFFPLLAGFVI